MSDLVSRLSNGIHRVAADRYKTPEEFKEAVGRGFVLVKFTETEGGTELGFTIDRDKSDTEPGEAPGTIKLVGPLTLDYVPVECTVSIDPQSLSGTGCLIPAEARSGAAGEAAR